MGRGSGGPSRSRPCSWKVRRWGTQSVPCAIGSSWRAAMASLEYVMAGWLRSRMLVVASVAAGRGFRELRPRPVPRHGGELELRDFLPAVGRLGGRAGGRPWLPSGGISPVYLVPLWALFSGVKRRMGWALWSSKVSPSGLSGALRWSSSRWRCQVTRICTPPFWPLPWRRYRIRALPPDPVAPVVVEEGLLDFRALLELWVCFGLRRCLWREGG